jgi:hypothetical protein
MNVLTNPNQAGIRSILRSINANSGQRLAQPIVQSDRKTISCRLSVFLSTERDCVGEADSRDHNERHGLSRSLDVGLALLIGQELMEGTEGM